MKDWLWTFKDDTIFNKKYIIVHTDEPNYKDILLKIYGNNFLCASYLLNDNPNKKDELKELGYKQVARYGIWKDKIHIAFYLNTAWDTITINDGKLTDEFKQQIWDKMTGGVL